MADRRSFIKGMSALPLTASTAAAFQQATATIISGSYSFAAPLIPSTSATAGDKSYMASFEPDSVRPFWRGYLRAYQRNANGSIPVDADGRPLASSLLWDAGAQLAGQAASARTIYTAVSGARQPFVTTNASITTGLLGVSTEGELGLCHRFVESKSHAVGTVADGIDEGARTAFLTQAHVDQKTDCTRCFARPPSGCRSWPLSPGRSSTRRRSPGSAASSRPRASRPWSGS